MSVIKQMFIDAPKDPVILGKFSRAYGVMGWLKVISLTENICNIINYQPWLVLFFSKWYCLFLEDWKLFNNNIIVKIKGIKNRDCAFSLTNCIINIDSSQLPSLRKDEYYWRDLIGCRVLSINGYQIGNVIYLISTGANDVLVVKSLLDSTFSTQEYLIPFIEDKVIKNVDLKKRVINVDWEYIK